MHPPMMSFIIYNLITTQVLIQYFSIANEHPDHSTCCCAEHAFSDKKGQVPVSLQTILCIYKHEEKVHKPPKSKHNVERILVLDKYLTFSAVSTKHCSVLDPGDSKIQDTVNVFQEQWKQNCLEMQIFFLFICTFPLGDQLYSCSGLYKYF